MTARNRRPAKPAEDTKTESQTEESQTDESQTDDELAEDLSRKTRDELVDMQAEAFRVSTLVAAELRTRSIDPTEGHLE